MKKQAHLKSNEASTEQKADATAQSGASADQSGKARRKKSEAPELPVPQAIASLAISALAISNSADTILRKAGADFGLADWALMQTLGAQAEAQLMGKLGIEMGVTRQRIQKQVDELQKSGLLSVSATAEDKRSRHVALTPAGRQALEATANLWAMQVAKTDVFGDLKSQAMVQRRVERIASMLSRVLRSEHKAAVAAKKAGKTAAETTDADE